MPKPYPSKFRDDVVRVARGRESGITIEQIAKGFGVHPMTLQKWVQRGAVADGIKPGQSRSDSAEFREARKRIRLLEQENEALWWAAAYRGLVRGADVTEEDPASWPWPWSRYYALGWRPVDLHEHVGQVRMPVPHRAPDGSLAAEEARLSQS